jgi:hypothetical protein
MLLQTDSPLTRRFHEARKTVSKAPHDFVDQLQDLEELYQELLALRMRVHQAERVVAKRVTVGLKPKATHPTRRKPMRGKRSK